MLKKILGLKLARFLIVGCCNSIVDLLILNFFVFTVQLPIIYANILAVSISICISYYLNSTFVFTDTSVRNWRHFASFTLVTGSGVVVIQTTVLSLCTHALPHLSERISDLLSSQLGIHIVASVILLNASKVLAILAATTWNYVLYNRILFRTRSPEAVRSYEA